MHFPLRNILLCCQNHCLKRVRIRSYSGPHFSRIFLHSDWIRRDTECGKNADQNKSRIRTLFTQWIMWNFVPLYFCWQATTMTVSINTTFFKDLKPIYRDIMVLCYSVAKFFQLAFVLGPVSISFLGATVADLY